MKFSYFKVHALSITLQCLSCQTVKFSQLLFCPTVPRSHSDSESEYSASNSEDDEGVAQEYEEDTNEVILSQKIPSQNRVVSAPVCKGTPSKKMKRDKTVSGDFNLKEKLCSILKISYPKKRDPNGGLIYFFPLLFYIFSVFHISARIYLCLFLNFLFWPVCIHIHVSMPCTKADISIQLYKK